MITIIYVPDKLDRCVSDVKKQGGVDNPWAVCNASIGKEAVKEKYGETSIQEKINANRQVPFFNPPIKKGKIEPQIQKTPKNVGAGKIAQDSVLWKNIFDSQLKRNVTEPKI